MSTFFITFEHGKETDLTQNAFTAELKKALIARGLNESEAIRSVSNITAKLTDESRDIISSYDMQTVGKIADRIVMLVRGNDNPPYSEPKDNGEHYFTGDDTLDDDEMIFVRRREEQRIAAATANRSTGAAQNGYERRQRPTVPSESPRRIPQQTENAPPTAGKSDTARMDAIQMAHHIKSADTAVFSGSDATPTQRISAVQNNNDDFIPEEYATIRERAVLTPEGRKKYIRTVVLASPIIAVCAALFFSCFGIFVAAVSAICAAIFVVFVAEIIAGCLLTLFSLIFGIVQLFSAVPIGIYEIGLSFIIAGVSIAVSVLTYKLSTGVLPGVIKRVCVGMRNTLYRLSEASDDYKRRCNEE